jgi:hypothetical protein
MALAVAAPTAPAVVHMSAPPTVLEGGCPEGSEPYGVLIEKSGAAYLVCRDKNGGGLIYVPLAAGKQRTVDA